MEQLTKKQNLRVRPVLPVYQVADVACVEQTMKASRGSNFRPRLKLLGTGGPRGPGRREAEEMPLTSNAPPPASREQLKRDEIQHEVVEHHMKMLERRNRLHVMDPTANQTRAISMALCEISHRTQPASLRAELERDAALNISQPKTKMDRRASDEELAASMNRREENRRQ